MSRDRWLTELSGNGRFELRIPSEYPFAEHPNARLRWLHAFLLRLRPGPHRAAFIAARVPPEQRVCSSCHRLSYNVAQNATNSFAPPTITEPGRPARLG